MSEVERPASVPIYIRPMTRYAAELIGTMVLVLMGCGRPLSMLRPRASP